MPRRIVRIRKSNSDPGINISLEDLLSKNRTVKRINFSNHSSCENTVYYLEKGFTNDKIFLVTQFFIHKRENRKKEINYCLKKNCKLFDKVILLNEKIYTQEELDLEDDDFQNVLQVDITKRLSYKIFLDYIRESGLEGYFVLSNTDIFFDETVSNLRKSFLSVEKAVFAISRREFNSKGEIKDTFISHDSQDTWIMHSNFFIDSTQEFNFNLGVLGCDNRVTAIFHNKGFKIYNCPNFIKTFHYHEETTRDYSRHDVIRGHYLYPFPVLVHRKVSNIIATKTYIKKMLEDKGIFWQYPVITEKKFAEYNTSNKDYLPIPWATIIDFDIDMKILSNIEKKEYITCCQHIHFRKIIPYMKILGVKILYTPHKVKGENSLDGIEIRPCPLYAVNFEDPERNSIFKDKNFLELERKYLYSFRGGWNRVYMSNIRKEIFNLEKKEDILIENSGGWHFEKTVYGGDQKEDGKYEKGNDVENYNQVLLNSRYSLCPSGTGPNSIRFWESLACGSIPVLLSDKLDLLEEVNWEEAIVIVKEKEIKELDSILRNISEEEERHKREKCLSIYQNLRTFNIKDSNYKMEQDKKITVVSYCCGTYGRGDFGGVARYDYQLSLIFKNRVFFQGPKEKGKMLRFLENCKNPLVITDNQLACDIPNKYKILLVHHGCARTTASRNPSWGEPWKSLCLNGQNKMLDHRDPSNTTIVSISRSCTDDFTHYYGEKYTKFNRLDILHPSELDETRYKTKFNEKPIILGNWNHPKKGQKILPSLKNSMKNFTFRQLNVGCKGNNFKDFNKRKQDIYLNSDIFLQIATSEGNSYATLDAMICGLVIVASDVGLFYKDVPENCFIKMEWKKNSDIGYVKSKISEAWERREELSKNCRQWYLDNCRFIDWEKKMNEIAK